MVSFYIIGDYVIPCLWEGIFLKKPVQTEFLRYLLSEAAIFPDADKQGALCCLAAAIEYCFSEKENAGFEPDESDLLEIGRVSGMLEGFCAGSVKCFSGIKSCASINDAVEYASEKAAEKKEKKIYSYDVIEFILDSEKECLDSVKEKSGRKNRLSDFISGLSREQGKPGAVSSRSLSGLTEKVKEYQKELRKSVFGQDNAISIFTTGYFRAELSGMIDKTLKTPKATFLFAGPPGVGKTFLAEKIAELLKTKYKRFDMSEYADEQSIMELCGINPSYKDAKEGALTGFVKKNPNCVLLFDEIEKANFKAIHLFLQILDAGILRDSYHDEEVSFRNAVIIFTTNAGRKIYEGSQTTNLSGISRKTILRALESDIDPKTGISAFPAAICSRFATGNVVMFNHMEAHSLRSVAEEEIGKKIKAIRNETGIECMIDKDIYSCILFAEGGKADARTVKSRAEAFLGTELYELFRLLSNEHTGHRIDEIKRINFGIDIPENRKMIKALFANDVKAEILAFTDTKNGARLKELLPGYNITVASSVSAAMNQLRKKDVNLIFCDLTVGSRGKNKDILNAEDINSEGRDFFRAVFRSTDAPIFILYDEETPYSDEEKFSLEREGARGFISMGDSEALKGSVTEICEKIHQQRSMTDLARSNKIVTYETSQAVSDDGTTADIRIYDIKLETAIDAEDTVNILSNISRPDVHFSDIIGVKEAIAALKGFTDYLCDPKAFRRKEIQAPKGILLYGPPGTGKTMLAKAMACECGVTFISASAERFLKKYRGEGEAAVRELFSTARKYAPTVVFVDNIDVIAREDRGDSSSSGSILTALLSEMDDFGSDGRKPVLVLAATNYDLEEGNSNFLSAELYSKFERPIRLNLPDKEERLKYIKSRMSNTEVFDVSPKKQENIAARSIGMSCAQLKAVFDRSARSIVNRKNEKVTDQMIEDSFESYNFGGEKHWNDSEMERTARHEAGHAFICWQSGVTPSYMTIVARGDHGGYVMPSVDENQGVRTKSQLLSEIRTTLGGRAAEMIYYGGEDGCSTGVSGDLKKATEIARNMVCSYGMGGGAFAFISEKELESESTASMVRNAVNEILEREMENALEIIRQNKDAVDSLVKRLLKDNHLSGSEINEVLSKKQKNNSD